MSDTHEELPVEWMSHPAIIELTQKLAELTREMESFKTQRQDIVQALKVARADKEDFLASIQKELRKYETQIHKLDAAERDINHNLAKMEHTAGVLRGEVTSTINGLSAHAELAEAREAWQEILDDQDWLWVKSIFDFQKVGAEFITMGFERDLFGVLLADQMGLGKTLQATAAINLIQYSQRFEEIVGPRCPRLPSPVENPFTGELDHPASWYSVLWVCPNSIKASTMREIAKWSSDLKVMKLEGNPAERDTLVRMAYEQGLVLVVSYEQLRQRKDEDLTPALFEYDWPLVIMDEAHKFKNETSSTFMNVERICKNAGYILPMTGTPIMNRPGEFWSSLHMLTLKGRYEGKFDQYWKFENDYLSIWGSSGQGKFMPGAYDRLIDNVKDMVLRRRKDEVLQDLPDKIREARFVELTGEQRELYEQMRTKFFVWLDEQKSSSVTTSNILAQLTYLRQIALLPAGVKIKDPDTEEEQHLDCWESAKIDEAMALIEDLLEAGEKVLVFSNFNEPLKRVRQLIHEGEFTWQTEDGEERPVDCDLIIGGVHESKRDIISHEFTTPESDMRVVCGNIAAMGVGLNLQGACSHAIFLDLFWNPGTNEQAEDRLHRQGQKNNVTIHIIQAQDTVDAFIAQKLEDKAAMIEGVIERDELREALKNGLI